MLLFLALEVVAAMIGFVIAAELIAIGTDALEPAIGQGFTGGVLVGMLGALPETVFVVVAMVYGSYKIALGSALGGNIILFTLGIGFIGVVYALRWKRPIEMKDDYKVELYFLLASSIFLLVLLLYGLLDRISGLALLALYVVYVGYRYASVHKKIKHHSSSAEGRALLLRGTGLLAAGALLTIPLSVFFVGLISSLSVAIGLSPLWLALVISPLAADMDENITGYRIAVKSIGGGSTAIVSFIGSKIQNNTMLIGLIGILAATPLYLGTAELDIVAVIVVNLVAIAVILRRKLSNLEGFLLVLLYVAVVIATFLY